MPTTPLRSVLQAAIAWARPGISLRTDAALLAAFVADRDEAAFADLVRRHGRLVRGTARRMIGDSDIAEDVFQATFLLLARKAPTVSWGPTVGPWLYQATLRIAAKARTRAARRPLTTSLGADLPAPTTDPASGLAWAEVKDALDRALAALPARLRDPLVLCYLEGLTQDEAATALGCSSIAVKGRVARGRERLRRSLASRGLTLSAALAAPLVVEPTVRAGEAMVIARTATSFLETGVAPAAVRALLPGTLVGWKLTAGLVTAVLVCAAGTVGLGRMLPAAGPPPSAAKADGPPPAPPNMERTVRVIVLDPQGKPLPGAKVHSGIWTEEKGFKSNHDYQTDAAGVALVELPKSFYILRLWASKKSFVDMFSHWEQNELASGVAVPAEYTMRLETGVTAGGRVVDELGKPIAGAKVQVSLSGDPKPINGDSRTRYNTWLAEGDDAASTDAEGRWHIDNMPNNPRADLRLLVSHWDYVSDQSWGQSDKAAGIPMAGLRAGTATRTLKRGVIVTGRVTDPTGKPIKDAIIVTGDRPYFSHLPCKFPTDADGRFRLPAAAPGHATLTIIAGGWAPQLHQINLEPGLPPQDFRMAPGKPIRLRVIDSAGKPVPKASVSIMGWKGSQSLESMHNPNHPKVPDTKIPGRADLNGVWEWASAPDDPVKLSVGMKGATADVEIAGGTPERTVVLKAEHRITGRVTDAVTGQPIPAFTVIPINVFRKDWNSADRGNALPGKNGRLTYLADRTDKPLRVRIEATGYVTQTGPEFRVGDDSPRTQDFRLRPSPPIVGTVLDAGGRPAPKAKVLLATPTETVFFGHEDVDMNHTSYTDAAGHFSFPDPGESWAVFAEADTGYAEAEFPAGQHDAGALRLRPWGSIRGQFRDGGKSVGGATISVRLIRVGGLDRPNVQDDTQTVTGPDGRFEFRRVPPGPVGVNVYLGPWQDEGFRSGPHVPFDLQPGQRAGLDLGGAGATVTGKVKLTGKAPADLDCNYSINYLVRREPGISPPPEIAALGFDARAGWQDAWRMGEEGSAYRLTLLHWFVKLAPDGSFRISGVPPGEYDLAVAIYAKPSGCLVDPLARQVVRVTVTSADVARGELAVPEIAAAVVPVPGIGDTPALTFRKANGSAGSLADTRGKFTLVHFWASWCGPCKQQLPAVRQMHEQFAARGLVTLGLSVDENEGTWQDAIKRLALPWPQGRTAAGEAGVSSVPMYWLLDPEGKIVAKGYDTDELAKALAERLK